ncbi:MAG: hypothetical protein CL878_15745 [Dehalococcoidia bacterium]|nr:hypothetical protein [Dehalococcoidia bacterium]
MSLQGLAFEAAYARQGGNQPSVDAIVERMESTEEQIRALSEALDGLQGTEEDLTATAVIFDGQATQIAIARQNGDAAAEALATAALEESGSHLRTLYDDLSTSVEDEEAEITEAEAISEMKQLQKELATLARDREEARQAGDRSTAAVITARMRAAAHRVQTLYATVNPGRS